MFKHVRDFKHKTTPKEAIGFYIAYLIFTIIVGAFLGGIVGSSLSSSDADFSEAFDMGVVVGTVWAMAVSLGLSFLVLKNKGLLKNLGLVALGVLAGLLAVLGGGLLGLIPVAYLTTKEAKA